MTNNQDQGRTVAPQSGLDALLRAKNSIREAFKGQGDSPASAVSNAIIGYRNAIARIAELEKKLDQMDDVAIQVQGRFSDAFREAHVALGGDGEWRSHVGYQPMPPNSGHLHLDVPVMARDLRESRDAASKILKRIVSESGLMDMCAFCGEDAGKDHGGGCPIHDAELYLMARQVVGDSRDTGTWTAWLIESRKDGRPVYAAFGELGVEWVDDALDACHFVHRQDAEQLAYGEDCDWVCEHKFMGPKP